MREEVVVAPYGRLVIGKAKRGPKLGEIRHGHFRAHYAHDHIGVSVEVDGFADYIGIGGVARLP